MPRRDFRRPPEAIATQIDRRPVGLAAVLLNGVIFALSIFDLSLDAQQVAALNVLILSVISWRTPR